MIMSLEQANLFEMPPLLPQGFRYQPEVVSREDEQQLLSLISALPFKDFEFHGFTGKRRVVSFGWHYDFNDRQLRKADEIPPFLLPMRQRAADFAGLPAEDFQHVLVTEYGPGGAIGWHKDKAVFGEIVGVSLASPCRFRFRRNEDGRWERAAIVAEPRSAYLLAGPSRTQWEHSISAMEQLRYSITFRNFERTLRSTP